MKREIKFRGKRIDNDEWIIGNLHIPNMLFTGMFICPNTTYGDVAPGFDDGEDFNEIVKNGCAIGHYHHVIPESVGQFTGLHDKNEKEIYEGDIISVDDWTVVRVEWGTDCWELIMEDNEPYIDDSLGNFNDLIEVIGNIYENSELIK